MCDCVEDVNEKLAERASARLLPPRKETDGEMLQRLGADGSKWAAEFRTTALRLGYSDMDEGWLIGWFANAIENARAIDRWAAEKALADAPSPIQGEATMCAGLAGTGRHAWMTEPCGDDEYGPDVTLAEIERHWQGVSGAFKRERDEARNAIGRVIQERDKAKADADYCAKSWEREIEANNSLREKLKELTAERDQLLHELGEIYHGRRGE